ncbi:MAG: hypothetical protein QOE09_931 [Ilumatobacteraceae bacterium]|jgi:hypothetical protein
MTDDTTPSEIVTLLTYVLDENREARELVRMSHSGLVHRSIGLRRRLDAVIRTRGGFAAGQAVQYLGENLERARDHWRTSLAHLAELQASYPDNERVQVVHEELRRVGVQEIEPLLALDALPPGRTRAAAHLEAVLTRMSDCDQAVAGVRSELMLQKMRNDRT